MYGYIQTLVDTSNLSGELTMQAASLGLKFEQNRERLVVEGEKRVLLMNLDTGWIWIIDKKTEKTIIDMHYLDALIAGAMRYDKAAKYLIALLK